MALKEGANGNIAPRNGRQPDDVRGSPNQRKSSPRPADALLACLVYISGKLGVSTTPARILRGLPVEDQALPIGLLERATKRIGLEAKIVERPLDGLTDLILPCILFLKDGDACVLQARSEENVTLVYPHSSRKTRTVKRATLKKKYAGQAVLLTAAPPASATPNSETRHGSTGHWFWSAVRQLWPNYSQIVLAAFLINLLALAVPLFTMNVYDRVLPNLAITTLWALAIGVIIALGFDFLLKMVRARVIERTGRRVDMAVSAAIFEKAMAIAMKDRSQPAGRLANQIKEFETIAELCTSSTVVALTDLCFIGIFTFVLWLIVGPLVLVSVGAIPLVLIVTLLLQLPLRSAIEGTQNAASIRHGILVESLSGIEAIKASTGESHMQRLWEQAIAAGGRSMTRSRFWSSLATNFTMLVQQSASVIIIVWGVYLVAEGEITTGALIAAMILSGRALAPLGNIANTIAQLQRAGVALRGIGEIMNVVDESQLSAAAHSRIVRNGAVEFRNASFTYPGAEVPALTDVSFRIEPGERVGMIGRIGSGKTTVGRLIAGLYTADDGLVLIDNFDVRQYHPVDLRRAVGFSTQDPELFTGTLRENIAFGLGESNDAALEEAGKIAGVDDFAAEHPLGYNMPIAERGRSLSGGQKQAVGLARILAREPSILFLDEPSSSMDTRSEQMMIQRLQKIADSGVTMLVSTHRSSLLRLVDRLLVFEKGALKMDGPRDEVMAALARAGEERPKTNSPKSRGRRTNARRK